MWNVYTNSNIIGTDVRIFADVKYQFLRIINKTKEL